MNKRHQYFLRGIIGLVLGFFVLMNAEASVNDQLLAEEILRLVNQYRVQHGLGKLTMDPILTHEASEHSRNMATHRISFGHDGFKKRMDYLHTHVPASLAGAENVAFNYKTAQIVVDGWVHSAGHRRNIMGHYNLTGIGIARDAHGKPYFTQMFLQSDPKLASARITVPQAKSSKRGRKAFKGFVG